MKNIALLCAFVLCIFQYKLSSASDSNVIPEDQEVAKFKAKVYATISAEDEMGFRRLTEIRKGQWLATQDEYPQTFDDYQERKSNIRPTKDRKTIVIQPLGSMTDSQLKVMAALREYTEAFFQLPVRLESPIPLTSEKHQDELTRTLPATDTNPRKTQFLAEPVMNYVLLPRLPKDAVVYLGITMEDLAAQDLNYVFGLGSLKKRVGVYSLCRYYPEFWGRPSQPGDETRVLMRACKILNHETGHLFGLTHCVFYACSMGGTNSLDEMDEHPLHYCPICQRKLQWNIGFDQFKQFDALQKFYRKHGMLDEARWIEQREANWKIVVEQEKNQESDETSKSKKK